MFSRLNAKALIQEYALLVLNPGQYFFQKFDVFLQYYLYKESSFRMYSTLSFGIF